MAEQIITQVSKDDEHSIRLEEEKGSARRGNRKTSGKSYGDNFFLVSLCCCFFGHPSTRPESAVTELTPTNHTPHHTNGYKASNLSISQSSNNSPYKEALLPPGNKKGKICLVLDLDETLVHSSFKPVPDADFVVPVEIETVVHNVYVLKRPGVDEFMRRVGEIFEIVVFTASLSKYADPVLDLLDIHKVVDYRLFRESCSTFQGTYVKDLGRIGRKIKKVIIIDNSPHSYYFHPENAIPVESWFDDKSDRELLDLIPFLEEASKCDDVIKFLRQRGSVLNPRPDSTSSE